ncbi:hypothetical protein STEG23_020049, partial [Scotinomys teguina]
MSAATSSSGRNAGKAVSFAAELQSMLVSFGSLFFMILKTVFILKMLINNSCHIVAILHGLMVVSGRMCLQFDSPVQHSGLKTFDSSQCCSTHGKVLLTVLCYPLLSVPTPLLVLAAFELFSCSSVISGCCQDDLGCLPITAFRSWSIFRLNISPKKSLCYLGLISLVMDILPFEPEMKLTISSDT